MVGLSCGVEKALCRALGKVVHKVWSEHLNALEIVHVKVQKLLGFYLVSLVAHARNLQVSRSCDYGGCGQVFWPVAS
jgi:hypothetical protein